MAGSSKDIGYGGAVRLHKARRSGEDGKVNSKSL